jgi:hypothetical protein
MHADMGTYVACSVEARVQSALSLIADYGPQVVDQIAAWFTRDAAVYAVQTFIQSLGGQPSAITAAEFILFPRPHHVSFVNRC